ncbi:hypothetical protein D922_02725 [Enterococcus faecalis 06-MB-DW-09]|nr:hypothetical protein D922_02725 [Enterococcus faecalis 06-MB-DW-09]
MWPNQPDNILLPFLAHRTATAPSRFGEGARAQGVVVASNQYF